MKSRQRKFDENNTNENIKKVEAYKGITGTGKTNQKLRLIMWNVNGIRSVISKFAMRELIAQYIPDFICINETKINAELYAKEKIKIEGYFDYWNFCKCSAGYSGVAVFSKFQPLKIIEDLEQPQHSQEGRVLTLQYEQFYLVVVYMPSAGDKELKRLQYKTQKYEVAFQKHCEKLKTYGKGVIVCGDMNVSHNQIDIHVTPYTHKQPGFTPQERSSFNKFINKGWIDTFRQLNPSVRQYTWWRMQHKNRDRDIGRRLDYFLVNKEFFWTVKKALILGDIMGSDHCPVFLELDLKNKIKSQQKQKLKEVTISPKQAENSHVKEIILSREDEADQKQLKQNEKCLEYTQQKIELTKKSSGLQETSDLKSKDHHPKEQ